MSFFYNFAINCTWVLLLFSLQSFSSVFPNTYVHVYARTRPLCYSLQFINNPSHIAPSSGKPSFPNHPSPCSLFCWDRDTFCSPSGPRTHSNPLPQPRITGAGRHSWVTLCGCVCTRQSVDTFLDSDLHSHVASIPGIKLRLSGLYNKCFHSQPWTHGFKIPFRPQSSGYTFYTFSFGKPRIYDSFFGVSVCHFPHSYLWELGSHVQFRWHTERISQIPAMLGSVSVKHSSLLFSGVPKSPSPASSAYTPPLGRPCSSCYSACPVTSTSFS